MRRLSLSCFFCVVLLLAWTCAQSADFDTPLAAIAGTPQLSETLGMLKKTGYDEPLGTGGDVTFLALSNSLLQAGPRSGERFSFGELVRDKLPIPAQLQVLQALTLDGQKTLADLEALLASEDKKATLNSVLGANVHYRLHRGKEPGSFVLEDKYHNGFLVRAGKEIATPNGNVFVVDALVPVPVN